MRRRFDLKNTTVLITGGSRGLGLVLARILLAKGCRVAICARDVDELERALIDLQRLGPVIALRCDVTDRLAVERMVAEVVERFGAIDVLINNAGLIQVGPVELMNLRDYQRAMDLHFWAPLYTCLAVVPSMEEQRRGRVVNIASIGGKIAVPHMLPYTASKFALTGFSQGLGNELQKSGIVVTTVCPAPMRTGSPVAAFFKGHHRQEYAWFALTAALPAVSVGAEKAARRIVRAIERGEREVVIGSHAKLGAMLAGLFPEIAARILAIVSRLLPQPGGLGQHAVLGLRSESRLTRSPLTYLSRRAALRNNEPQPG